MTNGRYKLFRQRRNLVQIIYIFYGISESIRCELYDNTLILKNDIKKRVKCLLKVLRSILFFQISHIS